MEVSNSNPSGKIEKPMLPLIEQPKSNQDIIKAFLIKQLQGQIAEDKKRTKETNEENKKLLNNIS